MCYGLAHMRAVIQFYWYLAFQSIVYWNKIQQGYLFWKNNVCDTTQLKKLYKQNLETDLICWAMNIRHMKTQFCDTRAVTKE